VGPFPWKRPLLAGRALVGAAALAIACEPGGPPPPPLGGPPASQAHPSSPPPPPPARRGATSIAPRQGAAKEGALAGGASDTYQLDLEAGRYLHATVDQQKIDLYVNVIAPGGRLLFQVDSPTGTKGLEHVHLLAETSGRYRLQVAAPPGAAPGHYRIEIEALRRATLADRRRAAAERAFHQARVMSAAPADFWQRAARYERAVRLFEELRDSPRQALSLLYLGRIELAEGMNRDALELFERAAVLYRRLGDRRYIAVTWNETGRAHGALGHYAEAEKCFAQALAGWRRLPDPAGEANTLVSLGQLEQVHGESWRALNAFKQAQALWQRLRNAPGEANALNGVGWVYRSLGDWERALAAHFRALHLMVAQADRAAIAVSLTQIGHVFLEGAEPQRALPYLQRAWSLQQGSGEAAASAVTLNSIGLCHLWLGRYSEALDFHRRSLGIFLGQPGSEGQTDAWINLGWTYDKLGEPARALDCLRRAQALARASHHLSSEALALLGMAAAERDRGHLAMAQSYGEASLAIFESIRAAALRPDLQTSFLARRVSVYGLLIDTLMARHPSRDFALQALARSEQARSRGLLDALAEAQEREEPSPAARSRLLARRKRIAEEIGELDLARSNPLAGRPSAASEEALADALERLNEVELQIRRAGADRRPPASFDPPTLAALQRRLLDPQTLLLEYYLGESRSFLWAASSSGSIQSAELPGRDRLDPLIRALYLRLSHKPSAGDPELEQQALELSRILFGPVASQWAGKRLLIAVQGALQFLPFAALPDPSGRLGPLVKSHEIVYVPSLSVLAALQGRDAGRAAALRPLAVIADPVFSADDERLAGRLTGPRGTDPEEQPFPRLDGSRAEAQALASLLPGQDVLLALGFDANRDLVTGGALSWFRILHFATHGFLRTDRPELPALVLSRYDESGRRRDGYLRSTDLGRLDLHADLVVLSACRSALGQEVAGEGLLGLQQAFLRAGARRVLVSLWDVEDRGAQELMRQFYRRLLLDKMPPARALREAQLALLDQPPWQSPYYWAGFVLQGSWP
jgi:CHAT domain-containing protein/tetratricopeptide (TPR) repeat protein